MNLIIKDAMWQILGRVASAVGGFLVIKLITPYLGPLRFGDYSTILKFFAIWSAFADFGIYVIALKQLGKIKNDHAIPSPEKPIDVSHEIDPTVSQEVGPIIQKEDVYHSTINDSPTPNPFLVATYGKFVSTRFFMIGIVYALALIVAYLIPAYSSNPYLIRGLPLGMLFSASFMSAGILQLPLQLFWKMKQLTVGLILARVAQLAVIAVTLFVVFTSVDFTGTEPHSIKAFVRILASVVVSGIVQAAYVWWTGRRFLPLKWTWDRSFTKNILTSNWQYGFAYYLSSFHTLVVIILISIFYPTAEGYTRVGIWALSLGLIEILLIIPSALGNSLIHDVAGTSRETMMKKFGSLLTLIIWIGGIIIINFTIFAPHIIAFVGGEKFLSSTTQWGSETILPFLAIILAFSFVKQVFNYIFVSNDLQNHLLKINLLGVVIGVAVGIPLIMKNALLGGLITQGILEIMFVIGALFIARRYKALPIINWGVLLTIVGGTALISWLGAQFLTISASSVGIWIPSALVLTIILTGISYPLLKRTIRGLS